MANRSTRTRAAWVWTVLMLLAPAAAGAEAAAAAPAAGPWPGWLGPKRDGHSPDTGLLKAWPAGGPKLLWKVGDLGAGWSSVAVVGDRIYVTGNSAESQVLYCLGADGKEIWKVDQGPRARHNKYPGARSTPTVDGDRVYVTGGNGLVTCHAATDGQIIWKRDMARELGGKVGGWLYAESVLIHENLAIVTPGGRNAIVALDKLTGQDAWKSDASATAGYSSCIAIAGKGSTIIVNGSQDGLLAVDARTGKKAWSHAFAERNTANVPTPAYADGMLFWGVGYGKGSICFKVEEGDGGAWTFKEAWRNGDLNNHPGNYVVAGGRVYGKGRGLVCVDLQTGKTLWSERSVSTGAASFADGMLVVFSDSGGKVSLVKPGENGAEVKGQFSVDGQGNSWAYPVVAGGRLYLRYDTNLYCYDVKAN